MLASAVMITASVAIERARCYTCKAVGPLGRREGAIAHVGTLDRPGCRQHAVELALSLHRIYATHRPIVAKVRELAWVSVQCTGAYEPETMGSSELGADSAASPIAIDSWCMHAWMHAWMRAWMHAYQPPMNTLSIQIAGTDVLSTFAPSSALSAGPSSTLSSSTTVYFACV